MKDKPINPSRLLHEKLQVAGGMAPYFLVYVNEVSIYSHDKRNTIYTRKSHEEGLEQAFNSLDAQRVAGESFVQSQHHEGWRLISKHYDDGGYSGGTLNRPALQDLLQDIENGLVDCVVVYKIDRLSRSLIDFSKIVELFDKHQVTFVAVTQS